MVDKTRYLTVNDLPVLSDICKEEFRRKGETFYGWQTEPAATLDRRPADFIWKQKLDGAYGERFALSVILASALVRQGRKVALLQKSKEPGLPFDADGWCIMSIERPHGAMDPLFHISPQDLPMQKVANAGLLTIVQPGSAEEAIHSWKGPEGGKPAEFGRLLDLVLL